MFCVPSHPKTLCMFKQYFYYHLSWFWGSCLGSSHVLFFRRWLGWTHQKNQSLPCVVPEQGKLKQLGPLSSLAPTTPLPIIAPCGPSSMVAQDWEAGASRDWQRLLAPSNLAWEGKHLHTGHILFLEVLTEALPVQGEKYQTVCKLLLKSPQSHRLI